MPIVSVGKKKRDRCGGPASAPSPNSELPSLFVVLSRIVLKRAVVMRWREGGGARRVVAVLRSFSHYVQTASLMQGQMQMQIEMQM